MGKIHEACNIGKLSLVKELVRRDKRIVNLADNLALSWTPLHHASINGRVDVVAYLLDHGAHVNATDDCGRTALQYAAFNNETSTMTLLIERGADMNHQNKDGRTPLHTAVRFGHMPAVRLLSTESKCKINLRDKDGNTAADIAKKNHEKDMVEFLENVNKDPDTSLSLAVNLLKSQLLDLLDQQHHHEDNRQISQASKIEKLERRMRQLEIQATESENKAKIGEASGGKTDELSVLWQKTEEIQTEIKTITRQISQDASENPYCLTDQMLCRIARKLGEEQLSIGILLGLDLAKIEQIKRDSATHNDATIKILVTWRDNNTHMGDQQLASQLKAILEEIGKMDLVRFLEDRS